MNVQEHLVGKYIMILSFAFYLGIHIALHGLFQWNMASASEY